MALCIAMTTRARAVGVTALNVPPPTDHGEGEEPSSLANAVASLGVHTIGHTTCETDGDANSEGIWYLRRATGQPHIVQ